MKIKNFPEVRQLGIASSIDLQKVNSADRNLIYGHFAVTFWAKTIAVTSPCRFLPAQRDNLCRWFPSGFVLI